MTVISVPARLSLAALALTFCIPLAAIETVIAFRGSWWSLGSIAVSIQLWTFISALISIPLAIWVSRGNRWALVAVKVVASLWFLGTAYEAIQTGNFWLGFFNLFVLLYWVAITYWLHKEMGRSFFDPRIEWFQGLPRAVPGLFCKVELQPLTKKGKQKEKTQVLDNLRASRLDRDGIFLFGHDADFSGISSRHVFEVEMNFRRLHLRVKAKAIRLLNNGAGLGLKFYSLSPDTSKDLGDFVEALRGEGYVQ